VWNRGWVLAGGLALLLVKVPAGWSQTDLSKLLVGRWTGGVRSVTGIYDRTLARYQASRRAQRAAKGKEKS